MWAHNHSVSFLNKTNLTNDLTTEWCWMQMQGQSTCIHNLILQTNNIILLFTVACFYVLSLPSQYMCIFMTKEFFLWCIVSAFALVYMHLYDKGIFLWCIESGLPTTNTKKLQYQHVFNLTAVKRPNLHFVHFIISFQNWHVLPILLPNKLLKKKRERIHK